MSINCANFCLYQIDGVCNLKNHNKKSNSKSNLVKSNCPYFVNNDKLSLL